MNEINQLSVAVNFDCLFELFIGSVCCLLKYSTMKLFFCCVSAIAVFSVFVTMRFLTIVVEYLFSTSEKRPNVAFVEVHSA